MRDPAGHLAERLELLCLAQRLLGLPLLGPVEEGGDGAAVLVRTMKNLERSSAGLLAFHERRAASSLDLGIEVSRCSLKWSTSFVMPAGSGLPRRSVPLGSLSIRENIWFQASKRRSASNAATPSRTLSTVACSTPSESAARRYALARRNAPAISAQAAMMLPIRKVKVTWPLSASCIASATAFALRTTRKVCLVSSRANLASGTFLKSWYDDCGQKSKRHRGKKKGGGYIGAGDRNPLHRSPAPTYRALLSA
jgi:hypothetical protein